MKEWLEKELEKVEKTYLIKATSMTGPYRRELALQKEYDGRQLLELLQNADDEAEETEHPDVLICLESNRLIFANNGKPFSESGIRSLIDSDNSPKIMNRKKIGYKGLGFRAVLNWSNHIWIKSGKFSLEFSRQNAITFFKRILEIKPAIITEIKEQFGQEYRYDSVCPVATLSVPSWKDDFNFDTSEYDTYVVISFSSNEIHNDIQNQINALGMEVALFLNNIRRIEIQSPNRNETIVRKPSPEDESEVIQIIDDSDDIISNKKWRIFEDGDVLPKELYTEESLDDYEYDLKVAVNDKVDDNINRLFSYFKTEVRFPFPAIVHGTFELDDSRNHLVKSQVNEYLLKKLASLMVRTAIELSESDASVNWNAMKLLAKTDDVEFDDKINQMNFYDHLLSEIRPQKLIPVLSNQYLSVNDEPAFYCVPFSMVLQRFSDNFHDMALYTEIKEVQNLMDDLGDKIYKPISFVELINEISARLNLDERTKLMLLISKNRNQYFENIQPENMPDLFIDDNDNIISSKTQALLPPDREPFDLPSGINITFISQSFFNTLKKHTRITRARDIASQLNCFNVDEYRFDTVVRKIVNVTTSNIKNDENNSHEYIQNMLSSLLPIFKDSETASFPPTINPPIITRNGTIQYSKNVYFGEEYTAGKIMEALYPLKKNDVFIAPIQDLGLQEDAELDVIEFLEWMGVRKYPKILFDDPSDPEIIHYQKYVLQRLNYPYRTDYDDIYNSYEELQRDITYRSQIKVACIKELDDILSNSRFEVVISWLHCDKIMKNIIENEKELKESSFEIWLRNKQNTRAINYNSISSYILWKLKESEWIKTKSGRKATPSMCCLSKTIIDISPLIEIPDYNLNDDTLKESNVKQEDIEYLLEKLGAARDFGRLSYKTIYSVLLKLEREDAGGQKARAIYRQIIQSNPRSWAEYARETDERKRFIEEGTLLARQYGELQYLPVRKVYYVDNITFCKQIIEKFPIAQIDRRSGKEQVRDIFGVTPLEDIHFILSCPPEVHPVNIEFTRCFEIFKPYILVFRLDKPSFSVELNRIKRHKIVICSEIKAKYEYDDISEELELNPYEHIYVSDENTTYLLLENNKHGDINDLKGDIDFSEALAEIITGILKVSENRKDYRNLFSKSKEYRNRTIANDLDDQTLEKLDRVRSVLSDFSDKELDFWACISRTKGSHIDFEGADTPDDILTRISETLHLTYDFVEKIYKGIDYDDMNKRSNLEFIKSLFVQLKITVKNYNDHSYNSIDFTEIQNDEFENAKSKYYSIFKCITYEKLRYMSVKDKEEYLPILNAYNKSIGSDLIDININLDLDIPTCFGMLFSQIPFSSYGIAYSDFSKEWSLNPDNLFYVNKKEFEKKIAEKGGAYHDDIIEFLKDKSHKSLLYFGELGILVKRYKELYPDAPKESDVTKNGNARRKKSINVNGASIEYEEDDYSSLSNAVKDDLDSSDYDISSHQPHRPEDNKGKRHGVGTGGGGAGGRKVFTKEIGYLGEKYVYELLCKKHSNVIWVSEYAKIANVNPEGQDGLGYDIWYLNESEQKIYVEVKASTDDEMAFSISKAEVNYGERNSSCYEVILVHNVCSKERVFINLGNIFSFTEEESFIDNTKFVVENNDYKIRFG